MTLKFIQELNFRLSEHPSVVYFRWSPTQSWGSTWMFLITSISAYIAVSVTLHVFLLLLRRRKPVPLGPIPALHSLAMALLSATIFAGILSSSVAEIRDTRWFWRRSKTPFQWLLCFPLGTRPSGRVFFWSYAFYLSRFLHIFRTFFTILRNPQKLPIFRFSTTPSSSACRSSGSSSRSLSRFATDVGLQKSSGFPLVMLCQIILVVTNLGWHVGVLVLHFLKGGCNGMGAWVFNTVLNSFVLLLVLNFYVKKCLSERDFAASGVEGKPATSEISYKLLMTSSDRL
ncbi:UNVERIFIED_CONTAM: Elongation of fatty acids protein 3-like [Sesamum radiatum]|uniref:Elongation of fatty acids protein 3-like n=1 Tax=Sesamum radiatum TaxID=300843 RepID=A0AAW2PZ22_SESRA